MHNCRPLAFRRTAPGKNRVPCHEVDMPELRGSLSKQIKLLHRFKAGGPDQAFWQGFVQKCRMAWGVFFPPTPGLKPRPRGIGAWANKMGMLLKGSVPADNTKLVRGRSYKEVRAGRGHNTGSRVLQRSTLMRCQDWVPEHCLQSCHL